MVQPQQVADHGMHAGAHEIGQNVGRDVVTRTLGAQAAATRSGTPNDPAKSPVDHASTVDRLNAPDRARVEGAAGAAIAPKHEESAYWSQWRVFAAWCFQNRKRPLPASSADMAT